LGRILLNTFKMELKELIKNFLLFWPFYFPFVVMAKSIRNLLKDKLLE